LDTHRIRLEGTYNFRDFGGYRTADGALVKRGVLYRSEHLAKLSPRAFGQFTALGIRLLVDLRTEGERSQRPNALPPNHGIRLEHLPISIVPELERRRSPLAWPWFIASGGLDHVNEEAMLKVYRDLGERAAEAIGRLFRLLLDPANHPALIHCMGGRDRTGCSAALILSVLGVPLDTVVADYELTNECTRSSLGRVTRSLRLMSLFQLSEERIRTLLLAHPAHLRAALDSRCATYGSVEGYLRERIGFSDAEQQRLRSMLLVRD